MKTIVNIFHNTANLVLVGAVAAVVFASALVLWLGPRP